MKKIKKKYHVFVQARFLSKRLRGKVLLKIKKKTILEIILRRLMKSKILKKENLIVLSSTNPSDLHIEKICRKMNIKIFRGPEQNVLKRFYFAAKKFDSENIVRVTGDCPLVDYKLLDRMIEKFDQVNCDYLSNITPPTFPDGLDIEIFNRKSLNRSYKKCLSVQMQEHVTQYIKKNKNFKKINFENKKDFSFLRLTLDEARDFKVICNIFDNFKNIYFDYNDVIQLYKKKKEIFHENMHIERNEGMKMNSGTKLWKKAETFIPGGSMLFSKNPNLFLPNSWPTYFSKTRKLNVWDLDKKKYSDMSLMGVGTNILGYSNPVVDRSVRKVINMGNMSTLNSYEEVELAEKLISDHPWSHKVRFTRSGGEAAAVAVRIARATTGRDKIAICGYHGWHDWYLAANLDRPNTLNNHLMKNLKISGTPKILKNLTYSFEYNNLNQIKKILKNNKLAAIVMEVARDNLPQNHFLKKIKNLAKKNGAILIFDECTSGFRETFGGLHLKYNVNPDMCILGKALGNGYAINAVLGTDDSMFGFKKTFISSTFWTERIGFAAGIATLDEMKKLQSWKIITALGKKIKKNWAKIAKRNNLKIKIYGLDALPKFDFEDLNKLYFKTFLTQEFLKNNILATNTIYLSISHENDNLLNKYYSILDEVFSKIDRSRGNIKCLLEGPVCYSGLRNTK